MKSDEYLGSESDFRASCANGIKLEELLKFLQRPLLPLFDYTEGQERIS